MPQKYTTRVLLTLGILVLAIVSIVPPWSPKTLFNSSVPWSQKLKLKPGIDMAGGTKLVYEIKAPDGSTGDNLAEQVMNALKKRVDPDGVRNLIWRPEGGNRLEIQMPLSNASEAAQHARDQFKIAEDNLSKTNVRRTDVIHAVEKLSGDARARKLNELAMGSPQREKLFGALAAAYDMVKDAEKAGDEDRQARAENTYDNLKSQIDDTNIASSDLQAILESKADVRDKRLAELRKLNTDFKLRTEAIDTYVSAWDQFKGVKGQLDDAGELKRLLRGSGVLAFHILVDRAEMTSPEARAMIERLNPGGKGVTPQAGDTMRWFEVDRPQDMAGEQMRDYGDKKYALCWTTPDKSMVNRPGQPKWALKQARVAHSDMGVRCVGFEFDAQGANDFGVLTSSNLKKTLGALLDDKIISAATINSTISSSGVIERGSGYTNAELDYLISTLNAGSLPAQLAEEPISEQTVGPQLGADNLRLGLTTCLLGLVVIGIFLIGYYHVVGMVAFGAVLMNVILILGAMAAFDATFTLPGVAGIVLTICIAVDANVLVFERLREEQLRGMGLKMAVRNAYDRAFSAILDANVSTAITAAVLYWVGSEEVKGFGLTLLLGMLSSMFTALFVTKTVYGILIDKFHVKKFGSLPLSWPALNKVLHPKVDWIGLFLPVFLPFSVITLTIGIIAFVVQLQKGRIFDIEFASGTSVQFELKPDHPMSIEEVRAAIETMSKSKPDDLPAPSVVAVGTRNTEYEVVTPNPNAKVVKEAVTNALQGKLKVDVPSLFDSAGVALDVATRNGTVLPITSDDMKIADRPLDGASAHRGGVAIVMRNLTPPISVAEMKTRIDNQRLQPQAGGKMLPNRDMDIEVLENGDGGLARSVVVLVSDSKYPYDKDPGKWDEELAGPTWRLINDAINNPAQLQKVTNFDAQVAGATQMKAIFALILSTLVIMVYIWFRFGDMKFGSATVAATIHDAAFMIGAIGISHYIADTAVGNMLMIEPFRMNLTMVAAILTVLGYSMNDTVVVFDRIRENRGKFGSVTRAIVNTSINETFSRTMLISMTSLVLVGIMYVFGGAGIHGFTFALLIGIIEGTYSSIAIAAPFLLIGVKAAEASGKAKRATSVAS